MSWSVFHTECMALTGMQHVSRVQFSQKMSNAYHNCVLRHFETLTAGGVVVSTAPQVPVLFQGFLQMCEVNMVHQNPVNWVQQVAPFMLSYWTGAIITGPGGVVTVTSPGTWTAPPVVQNMDFNIILYTFEVTARIQIASMIGVYVSAVVPGVTSPWSGGLLLTTP